MTLTDTLITQRESALNRLLSVGSEAVLNPNLPQRVADSDLSIAAEIKRAINAFKATAIDRGGGRVDYKELRHSEAYAEYRRTRTPQLRTFDLAQLETREERLAFWINLYNALVIDAVIALGVQQSVGQGLVGTVRFFRRAAYNVGGLRFSCEDIEQGILRANRGLPYIPGPQFGPSDPRRAFIVEPLDPRIHFALNCASNSCPPIGVYDPVAIDAQLDLATRNFVDAEMEVDPAQGEVHLSSIFRWYAKDWGGRPGVTDFILRYLPDDQRRAWLAAHRASAQMVYQPYDWSLNSSSA
jgi:hypothetical protein